MRVFIAIPLPADLKADLATLQGVLRSLPLAGAWVRASNLHITLKLIGEVEATQIDSIAAAMLRVACGCKPFSLSLTGVGVFPSEINPRVLWVGIEDSALRLTQLYHAIDAALVQSGFPREVRPFVPHLTIARLKQTSQAHEFGKYLKAYRRSEIGRIEVHRMELLESRLHPSGPEYVRVKSALLANDHDRSTR